MEWDKRCSQTDTNGVLVPGYSGLAAPYWKSGFETVFHQLENVSNNEIIRAGMESIGYLVNDIIEVIPLQECPDIIPASGGGARKPLLQFISDITENSIGHSSMKDRTAFGVLNLLKKTGGESILHETVECDHIFTPQMKDSLRQIKLDQWHTALRKAEIF